MRPSNHRMLAAAVMTAAMLCNTTVCAWASSGKPNTVVLPAEETLVLKSALTSGLEAQGQKPELPRLLPSDTKVKAVGKIRKFNAAEDRDSQVHHVLTSVYEALKEKGYDPVNQIVGYILSEDPTYITNHNGARTLICKIDRDELLQILVKRYLDI